MKEKQSVKAREKERSSSFILDGLLASLHNLNEVRGASFDHYLGKCILCRKKKYTDIAGMFKE